MVRITAMGNMDMDMGTGAGTMLHAHCPMNDRGDASVAQSQAAHTAQTFVPLLEAVDAGVVAWFETQPWTRFARSQSVRGPPATIQS